LGGITHYATSRAIDARLPSGSPSASFSLKSNLASSQLKSHYTSPLPSSFSFGGAATASASDVTSSSHFLNDFGAETDLLDSIKAAKGG
jgi:hypothetical protein